MVRQIGIYNVSQAAKELTKQNTPEVRVATAAANFEEAIAATGFGYFNHILMLLGVFSTYCATVISMTNVAYVIPALKCDFHISLIQIGILNASSFIGNILSPFLWGYLSDTMGRRKLFIYTAIADGICVIIYSFPLNITELIILKIISGFLILAPGGIIVTYLSECHGDKHRSLIILVSGILMAITGAVLPLAAWGILPLDIVFMKSWQLYLLLSALPSLIAAFGFLFIFPESPKYLMMIGKPDEALTIFKKIYSMNTGNPPESYPISKLCDIESPLSQQKQEKSIWQLIFENFKQFKPLFSKKYIGRLSASIIIQVLLMMGANTFRTWLPEIFTLMDNFVSGNDQEAVTVCYIIQNSINTTKLNITSNNITEDTCLERQPGSDVFIKLSIVGLGSIVLLIIVTLLSMKLNKKIILGNIIVVSGIGGIILTWTTNPFIIWTIASVYTAQTLVALVTFLSIAVDLFPTSFRTLAMMIVMTAGRIGSMLGNLLFPVLLMTGCMLPFLFLGVSTLICIIPLILLSSTKAEDV